MLTIVSKNNETKKTVVKRSNPITSEVYEYQVHTPDKSFQKFNIEVRYNTKKEADDYINVNQGDVK